MTPADRQPDDADRGGPSAEEIARRVLDENRYLVLGTADEGGLPWTSPVFYAAAGHHELFWISSPEVTHSRNLATRPDVSVVIFDSRAPVGTGDAHAVYMTATAAEVPEGDLERVLATVRGFAERGGRDVAPADLRAPAPYRLYRATVTGHSVICPRPPGVPCAPHGRAYDHRIAVVLP